VSTRPSCGNLRHRRFEETLLGRGRRRDEALHVVLEGLERKARRRGAASQSRGAERLSDPARDALEERKEIGQLALIDHVGQAAGSSGDRHVRAHRRVSARGGPSPKTISDAPTSSPTRIIVARLNEAARGS
jgi:hypothetical protein